MPKYNQEIRDIYAQIQGNSTGDEYTADGSTARDADA